MKKILCAVFALSLLALSGCTDYDSTPTQTNSFGDFSSTPEYRVVTIDNCEYYQTKVDGGFTLAHKGNCHNPYHKDNQK